MGIALLTFVDIWMPLQSLADRWLPRARRRQPTPVHEAGGLRYVGIRPACTTRSHGTPATTSHAARPVRPLRVVRLIDPENAGQRSHRVVISGRMADVCAELDRLAALEAMEAPTTRLH
ncbi:MAG: hypothetical protein EOP81_14635 [Variovorax sp.]|nr:MAG: hypothetical protein EOP81_14635 [Variovorax sp.]